MREYHFAFNGDVYYPKGKYSKKEGLGNGQFEKLAILF